MKRGMLLVIIILSTIITIQAEDYSLNSNSEYESIIFSFDNQSLYDYNSNTTIINNSKIELKKLYSGQSNLLLNINKSYISVSSEKLVKTKAVDGKTNTYWSTKADGLNAIINFTLNNTFLVSKIGIIQITDKNTPMWNETQIKLGSNTYSINLSNNTLLQSFYFPQTEINFLQLKPLSLFPPKKNIDTGLTEVYLYPVIHNTTATIYTKEINIVNLKQWQGYSIISNGTTINYFYSNNSGSTWYPLANLINKTDKNVILRFDFTTDTQSTPSLDEINLKYTSFEEQQNSTNITIPQEITYYSPGKYDDNKLTYAGTWIEGIRNTAYNQTFHYSSQDSSASFYFNGTKVILYTSLRNNRGYFDVYLDNIYLNSIDQYLNTTSELFYGENETETDPGTHPYAKILIAENLTYTNHNLTLVRNQSHNNLAINPYFVTIDAIEFLDTTSTQNITENITQNITQETSSGNSYSNSGNTPRYLQEKTTQETIEQQSEPEQTNQEEQTTSTEQTENKVQEENNLAPEEITKDTIPTGSFVKDLITPGNGFIAAGIILMAIMGLSILSFKRYKKK